MRRPAFFVPGRIEVLGKHTDYAGGRSLLCAVDRGVLVTVAPRTDATVRVTDLVRRETRELTLSATADAPLGDWANYVATVVRRVASNFPGRLRGADISFANDLPVASGLSSSSALSVAVFLALDEVNGFRDDPRYRAAISTREDLAAYIASIEMGEGFGSLLGDRGVGTFGGSEDHTAILCCRAEHLSRYAFLPTRAEGVIPFPADKTFVVAFSGVAAPKTGSALESYNEASLAVREIVRVWNAAAGRSDRSLAAATSSRPSAPAEIREAIQRSRTSGFTAERLRERLDQWLLESNEIVPRASAAFSRGDVAEFGEIVSQSQRAAELMLRNQIPETISLAASARTLGASAASAFGGGFGGSVWALTERGTAEELSARWRQAYEQAFPHRSGLAEFFVTRPGPGAFRL